MRMPTCIWIASLNLPVHRMCTLAIITLQTKVLIKVRKTNFKKSRGDFEDTIIPKL